MKIIETMKDVRELEVDEKEPGTSQAIGKSTSSSPSSSLSSSSSSVVEVELKSSETWQILLILIFVA